MRHVRLWAKTKTHTHTVFIDFECGGRAVRTVSIAPGGMHPSALQSVCTVYRRVFRRRCRYVMSSTRNPLETSRRTAGSDALGRRSCTNPDQHQRNHLTSLASDPLGTNAPRNKTTTFHAFVSLHTALRVAIYPATTHAPGCDTNTHSTTICAPFVRCATQSNHLNCRLLPGINSTNTPPLPPPPLYHAALQGSRQLCPQ